MAGVFFFQEEKIKNKHRQEETDTGYQSPVSLQAPERAGLVFVRRQEQGER